MAVIYSKAERGMDLATTETASKKFAHLGPGSYLNISTKTGPAFKST